MTGYSSRLVSCLDWFSISLPSLLNPVHVVETKGRYVYSFQLGPKCNQRNAHLSLKPVLFCCLDSFVLYAAPFKAHDREAYCCFWELPETTVLLKDDESSSLHFYFGTTKQNFPPREPTGRLATLLMHVKFLIRIPVPISKGIICVKTLLGNLTINNDSNNFFPHNLRSYKTMCFRLTCERDHRPL